VKNEVRVLKRMRQILDQPAHWTRHNYAVDPEGNVVAPCSPKAEAFCLYGAVWRAQRSQVGGAQTPTALLEALAESFDGGLEVYNDFEAKDHSDIVQLLNRALEIAQESQP
jgi:hypothetical protein